MKNNIEFKVHARRALFSDPITRIGGEKFSYQIPTYEALKGIVKSIYWKPTIIWHIDKLRIIKPFRTQSLGVKPLKYCEGGNDLSIYTYLTDVEYQVEAHFEWNLHRPELEKDRIEGKHFEIAKRMLAKGGRQDIFLGTRECQGYVEPESFGTGKGAFDEIDELSFPVMFFGFGYPDETGKGHLETLLWSPKMIKGVIEFPRPEHIEIRREVRPMTVKDFGLGETLKSVVEEVEAI